jgi:hypothetical protein
LSEWEAKKEEIGEMSTWDRPEIQGDFLFSKIETIFLGSMGPPKISSRDFSKLQPLPPLRNKNSNGFKMFPTNRWHFDSASSVP